MKVITEKDLPLNEKTACSIGNFDGFHEGHIKVLQTLKENAKKQNLKTVVISFYPHPREFFTGKKLCKITNLETKKEFLKEFGVDYFLIINFSQEFASITKEQFVKLLKEKLNCELVVVGEEWKFGKNKEGDVNYLKNFIKTVPVKKVNINNKKLGSSILRELLRNGKIEEVNSLLKRPYCVKGKIVKGRGLGRKYLFPTINVDPEEDLCLKKGVYAGYIKLKDKLYKSAINFGVKPTVGEEKKPLIEVFVLDKQDLKAEEEYAKVYFIKYIREERKFDTLDQLKSQIEKDIKQIKQVLSEEKDEKSFYSFSTAF